MNTCKSCAHSKTSPTGLSCWRLPPVVHFIPQPNHISGEVEMKMMTTVPPVQPTWSCSEYIPGGGAVQLLS